MKMEEQAREVDDLMVQGENRKALEKLRKILDTENEAILDNPYFHLRKGQCHFFLEELEDAAQEFITAYALDGERVFEDEDPRFLDFLRERISGGDRRKEG